MIETKTFSLFIKNFLIFLLIVFLIFLRYFSTRPDYPDGKLVRITFRVGSEPIRYQSTQQIKLSGLTIYLPLFPEFFLGDKIVVEGRIEKNDKVQMTNVKLLKIIENQNIIYGLRKHLLEFYKTALPEPDASLVAGMVIGSKGEMPTSFWNSLKATGTAHMVVASGTNVSFVAGFLFAVLAVFFKRKVAVIFALFGVWFYALLSGFDAPIVRAAIMGSLTFAAQALGRVADAKRILFITAAGMLLVFSNWLVDVGFWMSTAATGAILLLRFPKFKIPKILYESLSVTVAAQIGVTPIMIFFFHQFSLLAPLTNLLLLWTVPYITAIGAISGIVGLISNRLGGWLILLVVPLTQYFVKIIQIFSFKF